MVAEIRRVKYLASKKRWKCIDPHFCILGGCSIFQLWALAIPVMLAINRHSGVNGPRYSVVRTFPLKMYYGGEKNWGKIGEVVIGFWP